MAKKIDLANEQKYLSNLATTGDVGQQKWAQAKAKEYGLTLGQPKAQAPAVAQPAPVAQPTQASQAPIQQTNPQMQQILQTNQQMGDANFQQQKAQLDMMLNAQVTQLKMAYDQAITDGQLSVRDAEQQFTEQKSAIEQQAYLDAERTGLYAQDMGIQNSQQAIGLMQGDNARKNGMINQNMTTRDKRVSDIKDRLTSIKTQSALDLARVQAEHGYGILGARAQTNQQVNQNAFGLMQDDYSANRQQSFDQQNMATQQGYTEKNMDTQFQNALKSATHESGLAIQRMNIQQGFDMAKMKQAFNDDVAKMAKQFGYSSALNTQEQKNRIATISAQYEADVKAEESAYNIKLERDLRGVRPGTKEYEVITKNAERDIQNIVLQKHVQAVSDANDILLATDTTIPVSKPKNYKTDGITKYLPPSGAIYNAITGYEKNNASYNAYQSAIDRKKADMESIKKYIPWLQQ